MKIERQKQYDLEERTCNFARRIRMFVDRVPKTLASLEDCKQLIRSSGSIAANYIEANENLGKKDFLMRIKICRKEAKESSLWLNLIRVGDHVELEHERQDLLRESQEFVLIFAAILRKCGAFSKACLEFSA